MFELYAYLFGNRELRNYLPLLAKSPLFKDVSTRHLLRILERTTIRAFKPGDHVFFEKDPASALYVILEGTVTILKHQGKKTIPLAELERGTFFGEMALVDEAARSATALVTDHARLLCLFQHDLDLVIRQMPRTGAILMRNIAHIMAIRLRVTTERSVKNQ